jgi:hypothetical protein
MRCRTCAVFHASKSQCRRDAPQPQTENNGATAVWPAVAFDDWCGAYRPRPPPRRRDATARHRTRAIAPVPAPPPQSS